MSSAARAVPLPGTLGGKAGLPANLDVRNVELAETRPASPADLVAAASLTLTAASLGAQIGASAHEPVVGGVVGAIAGFAGAHGAHKLRK